MKKLLKMFKCFLCFCALVFLCSGCALTNPQVKDIVIKKIGLVEINGYSFEVELAKDPIKQYQGLSGRQSLAEDQGMLFVFNDYAVRYFVMRGMNFPLDIVWIKDNQVVGCEKNVPILDSDGLNSQVNSNSGVNYVLEINAGLCERYRIEKSNSVIFEGVDK